MKLIRSGLLLFQLRAATLTAPWRTYRTRPPNGQQGRQVPGEARQGDALRPQADRLVTRACENRPPLVDLTREVVAALPVMRRNAIVLAWPIPASVGANPTVRNRRIETRVGGWAFLDLANDKAAAARRAVRAIATREAPTCGGAHMPAAEAVNALRLLGEAGKKAIVGTLSGIVRSQERDMLERALND